MIKIFNTGLSYVLLNDERSLCSFPTRKLAVKRALELSKEFGVALSSQIDYWIKIYNLC